MHSEDAPGAVPSANHLVHEKSPYLLMHAHNPVDWYPWGEDAFAKARREQKPIFLSVGYSTCHWCHVMEHESFSDPKIAAILNRDFVSIKVDREERPDVDRLYMTFVQATTGSGGWPMSVFLTPDLKPFFGGTYFPPDDRYGRPGFQTVLLRLAEAWKGEREKILESASQVTAHLEKAMKAGVGGDGRVGEPVLDRTYEQVRAGYEPHFGGFGSAPKFPRPVVFNFLLRYYARTSKRDALEMTLHTLRVMARGGIHDHLGGGFHRYSTDARWHLPHFEKMLYDQAQLAVSYLEAYQLTHDQFFAATARDILGYVLRDLRGREGGFYSAEDADSLIAEGRPDPSTSLGVPERSRREHGEGAFYVWTAAQIEEVLGKDAAQVFDYTYGVEPDGNVLEDPHGEFEGKNVLFLRHSLADTAKHFGKPEAEVDALLAEGRKKLLAARARRPRPSLDDKVLTAWNGLMISALAKASQVLEDSQDLAAGESAARFIQSKLYDPQSGQLKRRFRAGEVAIDGFLDDYAFLIQGLLDLFEASSHPEWLAWAMRLQEKQDQLFWDAHSGGYFSTGSQDPSILLRLREDYDGAEPAANSVAALNLLRLAQLAGAEKGGAWRAKADKLFLAASRRLETTPEAAPLLVAALDFSLSKPRQIIIAGQPDAPDTRALLRLVHERFIPNKILLVVDGGAGQRQLTQWLPFIEGMARQNGRATAYICENFTCKLPTADLQEVARLLDTRP